MLSPALVRAKQPNPVRNGQPPKGWPFRAMETIDMTELSAQIETLDALVRRHAAGHDLPRHVPHVRLADALARGDDPLHLLPYFSDLGVRIGTLEDLLAACADPGEEEIEAFRIEEGVAVLLVTDGQWMVFTR